MRLLGQTTGRVRSLRGSRNLAGSRIVRCLTALGLGFLAGAPPEVRAVLEPVQVLAHAEEATVYLNVPTSVVVSPEGLHVYVTGDDSSVTGADGLAAMTRDAVTGVLTLVHAVRDGDPGIDGLAGAEESTQSPDALHLYVVASQDDAVSVWTRNPATGALTFVEHERDGAGGVDGLDGARAVAVSPDGAHVYVAALLDDAITVFARNGATGALTLIETERDGVGGVDGLGGAAGVVVSPDGAHVYVAGSDPIERKLAVFARDGGTGGLTFVEAESTPDGLHPGLAVSPDGAHLYVGVFGNAGAAEVATFARDAGTGMLTPLSGGTLVGYGDFRDVLVSADGLTVYATAAAFGSGGGIVVFTRDPATGLLTPLGTEPAPGGDGDLALSPDGLHLYVARFIEELLVFDVLAPLGDIDPIPPVPPDGLRAHDVAVSPGGLHVYLAGPEGVGAYARDATTGTLTLIEVEGAAGGTSGIAVSPEGTHLYTFGAGVGVFARDGASGEITLLTTLGATPVTRAIAVSPDGQQVYGVHEGSFGASEGTLAVFDRNLASGALTLVEVLQAGSGDVAGLEGFHEVVVSPDSRHVYLSAFEDDAVAIFERDGGGGLELVDVMRQGDSGADGLDFASGLALSPDGRHLYTTSRFGTPSVLGVFERDQTTGLLAFIESHAAGSGSLYGEFVVDLGGIGSPAVVGGPDGPYLVIPTAQVIPPFFRGALAVFARDPATGRLAFTEMQPRQGAFLDPERLYPLSSTGGLAVAGSDDGRHVYLAGGHGSFDSFSTVGVVAALEVTCGDGVLDPGDDCDDGALAWGDGCNGGCQTEPCFTCTGEPSTCTSAVLPLCRLPTAPRKAFLDLRDKTPDRLDALTWKWTRGADTALAAFGDSRTTTEYELCVFDGTGLVLNALAPAGHECKGRPCWKVQGSKGFKYKDPTRMPDGLLTTNLTAGPDGKANILSKGKGPFLDLPALPLNPPVTVQLRNTLGECWEAVFGTPLVNQPGRFKALSD